MKQLSLAVLLVLGISICARPEDLKMERSNMNAILDMVAADVQKNFYDPKMNGLDWKALIEQGHKRIASADHVGEMISTIFAVINQLHDSHTVFIPPGRTERAIYGFKAEAYGNDVYVYKVERDGPSARVGLKVGDKLVGINNFNVKRDGFDLMMLYFRVLNPAKAMGVTFTRDGGPEQTIEIATKLQPQPALWVFDSYAWHDMMNEWDETRNFYEHNTYDGDIRYVKIKSFMAAKDWIYSTAKHLDGGKAAIVDLRGNLGGSAETMYFFSGFWTPQPTTMGKIVFRNKTEDITIKPQGPQLAMPTIVLLDSESASASELFARYLQMQHKAIVIGDRSSGRVNMAKVFPEKIGAFDVLLFGSEVAVAKLVMPDGQGLENKGVVPDQFCVPTAADLLDEKKDPCLDVALAYLHNALNPPAVH